MKLTIFEPIKQDADNRIQSFAEKIGELKSQYSGLTIAGIEDKAGYKSATEAAKAIRADRLQLQKKAKTFTDDLKGLLNYFGTKSKSVISEYQALEDEIRSEIKRIDAEKQEAKEAERREKLRKFNERTDLLFETGFVFDGYQYKVGTVFVVSGDVGDLSDDKFNALVEKGRQEAERLAKVVVEAVPEVETHTPDSIYITPKADVEKVNVTLGFYDKMEENENFAGVAPAGSITELKPDLSYRPAGFSAGFDACRNKVLEILERPDKFTRAQLKELIIELKP